MYRLEGVVDYHMPGGFYLHLYMPMEDYLRVKSNLDRAYTQISCKQELERSNITLPEDIQTLIEQFFEAGGTYVEPRPDYLKEEDIPPTTDMRLMNTIVYKLGHAEVVKEMKKVPCKFCGTDLIITTKQRFFKDDSSKQCYMYGKWNNVVDEDKQLEITL